MKQSLSGKLLAKSFITKEIFRLDFAWAGTAPKAGQFFLIKPKRSSVFLGRPISAAHYLPDSAGVCFFIAYRGRGIEELASMHLDDEAELTGPLGNCWGDFVNTHGSAKSAGDSSPVERPIALIGGGIGVAPLLGFADELTESPYDCYGGFKSGFINAEERFGLLGQAGIEAENLIIATEDGSEALHGRIPDFLDPTQYQAVCACGPEPMLNAVTERCKEAGVPCFISMERHMACGVGACLGCTVKTVTGNRRCCADGPIFPAEEIIFNG
jgi:NAD(P)H-flavin reductase